MGTNLVILMHTFARIVLSTFSSVFNLSEGVFYDLLMTE